MNSNYYDETLDRLSNISSNNTARIDDLTKLLSNTQSEILEIKKYSNNELIKILNILDLQSEMVYTMISNISAIQSKIDELKGQFTLLVVNDDSLNCKGEK